jgi:ferredoxin
MSEAPASAFHIRFSVSGREAVCPPGMTVLEAAEAAGIKLPFSCREGMCATCKSVLASGQVDMQHKGAIRPKEIAAGKFLPCCSRPLSDLVVER